MGDILAGLVVAGWTDAPRTRRTVSGTEIAIVLAAVVVGSVAKAVTGMGLPLVAIPIASLFVDVETAIVVIALPNVLANGVLAARERRSYPATRDLPVLATFGVVGAVAGAVLLVNVPATPLVIAVIVAIVGYVVTFLVHPDLAVGPDRSRRLAPGVGAIAGVFQGAVGISGPIVGSWIHSYRLPRAAHILSVTSLFLITGVAQLTVIVATGALDGREAATLAACVPVLASLPVGTRMRDAVSGRGFDLAIIVMLSASAVALAVQTAVG